MFNLKQIITCLLSLYGVIAIAATLSLNSANAALTKRDEVAGLITFNRNDLLASFRIPGHAGVYVFNGTSQTSFPSTSDNRAVMRFESPESLKGASEFHGFIRESEATVTLGDSKAVIFWNQVPLIQDPILPRGSGSWSIIPGA